jgi:hypothetical protein
MTMVRANLLKATCAVVLLAATPVLAQTNTEPADTGTGGKPNTPTVNEGVPAHPMHHAGSRHHHAGTKPVSTSQSSETDRLNEQSYQAAQKGQAYGSGDTGTPTAAPSAAPGDTSGAPASSGGKM